MSRVVFDFSNERYVITGASSGIGRQIAMELVGAGATILGLGRSEERLRALKETNPEQIITATVDVRDADALEAAINDFVQIYGKLNGGVHAAGITGITPFRDYDQQMAREIMETSFWAGIELLRLITKAQYGNRGTSTVLLSSGAALSHARGMFAYSAAKSAINAALGSVAREISAKRHRVNSILPGWVLTPMTEQFSATYETDESPALYPLGLGSPEDVSGVVLFLLSSAARWITGANVVVDGGHLA